MALASIYIISLSKKNFLKPYVIKAGIAVYTEIASTHNTDVWSTSKYIIGNICLRILTQYEGMETCKKKISWISPKLVRYSKHMSLNLKAP